MPGFIFQTMTEYEFDKLCEKQYGCDGICTRCPLFAEYQSTKED